MRHRPYVEAARGLGSGGVSIVFRDIFPSVLPVLIVQLATAFAWGILDEASIGFLGLGVQPPTPSWGSLLIEGRQYLYDAPWLPIGAGAVVVLWRCVPAITRLWSFAKKSSSSAPGIEL